jgi:hypothetical protein
MKEKNDEPGKTKRPAQRQPKGDQERLRPIDDPFAAFTEWNDAADRAAYAELPRKLR